MAFNVRQIFSALNDAEMDYVMVGAGRPRDLEDIVKLRQILAAGEDPP